MLSSATRIAARRVLTFKPIPARRLLTTTPPAQRSRSWKSSAARWGVAIGGIWYYNTSSVFAEQPDAAADPPLHHIQDAASLPTIDAIVDEKREREAQVSQQSQVAQEGSASVEDLEEEADQQGAFNPETGEINWDCPCLGGMAHGPCGPEFKEAFSCFVFSKEEPKGMDCIDKFKGMQDCFREHPDHYGSELEDDEEGEFDDLEGGEVAVARDGDTQASSSTAGKPPAEQAIEVKAAPSPASKAVESAPAVIDEVVQKATPDVPPTKN